MENSYSVGIQDEANKLKTQNQVVLNFYKTYPYNYLTTLKKKLLGFCAGNKEVKYCKEESKKPSNKFEIAAIEMSGEEEVGN